MKDLISVIAEEIKIELARIFKSNSFAHVLKIISSHAEELKEKNMSFKLAVVVIAGNRDKKRAPPSVYMPIAVFSLGRGVERPTFMELSDDIEHVDAETKEKIKSALERNKKDGINTVSFSIFPPSSSGHTKVCMTCGGGGMTPK